MNENSMMQPVWVVYDLAPAHHEGAIRDKLIEMGWTPPSAEPARPVEAAGALAATTFICHLIDNHEGEKVTEESLQSWLAETLAHPRPMGDGYDVARHNEWLEANAALTVEQAGEVAAVAEVVSLRSDNYGHHHRIKWLDHYANAFPVGTKLYAQARPVGVPDGWKLVPVKAMREITEAGRKSLIESSKANVTYDTTAAYAYEEMVAAAPAPDKGGEA